jgi:hypothetical protein
MRGRRLVDLLKRVAADHDRKLIGGTRWASLHATLVITRSSRRRKPEPRAAHAGLLARLVIPLGGEHLDAEVGGIGLAQRRPATSVKFSKLCLGAVRSQRAVGRAAGGRTGRTGRRTGRVKLRSPKAPWVPQTPAGSQSDKSQAKDQLSVPCAGAGLDRG